MKTSQSFLSFFFIKLWIILLDSSIRLVPRKWMEKLGTKPHNSHSTFSFSFFNANSLSLSLFAFTTFRSGQNDQSHSISCYGKLFNLTEILQQLRFNENILPFFNKNKKKDSFQSPQDSFHFFISVFKRIWLIFINAFFWASPKQRISDEKKKKTYSALQNLLIN